MESAQLQFIHTLVEPSDGAYINAAQRAVSIAFPGYRLNVSFNCPTSIYAAISMMKQKHSSVCLVANPKFLKLLIDWDVQASQLKDDEDIDPSLNSWRGSTFNISHENKVYRFIVCESLSTIYRVKEGAFLFHRWLQKACTPELFFNNPLQVDWELFNPDKLEYWENLFKGAILVALDIETQKEPYLYMQMCGYSLLLPLPDGSYHIKTVVVPMLDLYHYTVIKNFNRSAARKIAHNGEYENTWFTHYSMPQVNYFLDTMGMQWSNYQELDKDLNFTSAFWNLNHRYWKEDRKSKDKLVRYFYNAKDCHFTLCAAIGQISYSEPYANHNYATSVKIQFPALFGGMHGILVDQAARDKLKGKLEIEMGEAEALFRRYVGAPHLNLNSPAQMSTIVSGLSGGKITGTNAKSDLRRLQEMSPLYARVFKPFLTFKGHSKAISSYINADLFKGRLLYKIDPFGTETGRAASKASSLWCGTNVQNQPGYAKVMYIADEGFDIFEIDNSQSESRTTAYLYQDENLINTVETAKDFHKTNASLFFGMAIELITAELRKLAKPINHGANYNMSAPMLAQIMGSEMLLTAKRLLELPMNYSLIEIADYLLSRFDKAYPRIRGEAQKEIIAEIRDTGMLVLPDGFTRRTFLKPWDNKPDLNAAVAHKPQSLSVRLINAAWFKVWYKYCILSDKDEIRFLAQIHDSLFGLIRSSLPEERKNAIIADISAIMSTPITVHGRTLSIPNDPKLGAKRWSDLKD